MDSKGILKASSYDVRQEINSKVIGVLKYNNDIREKSIQKIWKSFHISIDYKI